MYFPRVLKPRPILFDLGDTLLNFSATNPLPYMKVGTRLGYEYMESQSIKLPAFTLYHESCRWMVYISFVVAHFRQRELDLLTTLRRLHRLLKLPTDGEFLLHVADRFYEPMKRMGTVEEGVLPILQGLVDQGHPLGIVSNTMVPGRLLDKHLEDEGLLSFFPVRIYSCDTGRRKPHPSIFLAALRAMNIKPQGALYIGDKPKLDVKGAARLGMTTVLKVRTGLPPRSRHKADHVIKHLIELPQLLDTIGPQCEDGAPLLPPEDLTRHYRPRDHEPLPTATQSRTAELP